jgi:hypothetical protein
MFHWILTIIALLLGIIANLDLFKEVWENHRDCKKHRELWSPSRKDP